MSKAVELKNEINSLFKKDVLRMGSNKDLIVKYLPTNILPMDILLQGGLPRGRFVEIFGDYSTLKSYIGLSAIAHTQKNGGTCAIIDTEHSFDPSWAEEIGVDLVNLIVIQPDTGEEAIDSAEALISGGIDLIVYDSIAASLPQAERNKRLNNETIQMARLASLMSIACRKLTSANSKTAMLWINQTRMNVGITFGNPETTPGGKSMPFYASYRLNMKKVGKMTNDILVWDGEAYVKAKEQTGQKFKAIVEKSKLSKPFRDVYFTWDFVTGQIDEVSFLIGMGLEEGTIDVKGSTWRYGKLVVKGREKFKEALAKDVVSLNLLREQVKTLHGLSLGKIKPATPAKSKAGRPRKNTSKRTK